MDAVRGNPLVTETVIDAVIEYLDMLVAHPLGFPSADPADTLNPR